MDIKLKAKWVRALRSGRYKQTRSALIDHDVRGASYCCLGVLCTAAGAKWKDDPVRGDFVAVINGNIITDRGREKLAPFFLRQIGLTKRRQDILTELNDGTPTSAAQDFKQIADYIEKHL